MSSSVLNSGNGLQYGNVNASRSYALASSQNQMRHLVRTPEPAKPESTEISRGFINKLVYVCATLLVLVACFYGFAVSFGDGISRGGHSIDKTPLNVVIGPDSLAIPGNTIRFDHQRRAGQAESIELYLHWPSLSGYAENLRAEYNKPMNEADLVFLSLEKRIMTFDMSGRVTPIYERFFEGEAEQTSIGLIRQPLSAKDGFIDEDLYYAADSPYPYATRCVRSDSRVSTPFCIRDIHVGKGLMLTYRFHKRFLSQWIELDQALRAYMKSMITNL